MDTRGEVHLGRLEGVVGGEMDGQEEDAAHVGTLILSTYVSYVSVSSPTSCWPWNVLVP